MIILRSILIIVFFLFSFYATASDYYVIFNKPGVLSGEKARFYIYSINEKGNGTVTRLDSSFLHNIITYDHQGHITENHIYEHKFHDDVAVYQAIDYNFKNSIPPMIAYDNQHLPFQEVIIIVNRDSMKALEFHYNFSSNVIDIEDSQQELYHMLKKIETEKNFDVAKMTDDDIYLLCNQILVANEYRYIVYDSFTEVAIIKIMYDLMNNQQPPDLLLNKRIYPVAPCMSFLKAHCSTDIFYYFYWDDYASIYQPIITDTIHELFNMPDKQSISYYNHVRAIKLMYFYGDDHRRSIISEKMTEIYSDCKSCESDITEFMKVVDKEGLRGEGFDTNMIKKLIESLSEIK